MIRPQFKIIGKVRSFVCKETHLDFLRNTFTLASGNALAQIITIVTIPIITRLFSPEHFGILALFTASITIISKISSLCYERAILLPKENKDANNLLLLSFYVLTITTFLTLFAVVPLKKSIAGLLKNEGFEFWLQIIPIGVFLSGILMILRRWRLRNKEFKSISYSRIWEALFAQSFKIIIGLCAGAYAFGLIWGNITGLLLGVICLVIFPNIFNPIPLFKESDLASIKRLANHHKKFPMFASWNALLNVFSQNLLIFAFSSFFSPVIVGYVSIGNRLLRRPLAMISDSIQNVYFQKCAQQLIDKKEVIGGLRKSTIGLFAVSIVPILIIGVWGEPIFGYFLGEKWGTAGFYAQILSPWIFFRLLANPSYVIFEVCQQQNLRLFLNIFSAILRIVSLFGGFYLSRNPVVTLSYFSAFSAFAEILTIYFAFILARKNDRMLTI